MCNQSTEPFPPVILHRELFVYVCQVIQQHLRDALFGLARFYCVFVGQKVPCLPQSCAPMGENVRVMCVRVWVSLIHQKSDLCVGS